MAPSVSISILVVALVLCNFMHDTTMVSAAGSVAASEPSSALEQERKALRDSRWWNRYSDFIVNHCRWPGITCNVWGSIILIDKATVYVRYKSYEISKFNFSSLPNLVGLNLSCNCLWGSIPHEIGTLSKLPYLDLSQNLLTGELPISLTNLTQLVKFDISSNQITGSIPRELGNLKKFIASSLSNNKFIGPIPSALGLLKNLSSLNCLLMKPMVL